MCGRRTPRRDAWHLHGADDRVQRTDALARRRPRAFPSTSAATPAEAAAGSRHARSRSIRVGRGGPPGRNRAPPSRPFAERYLRQTPRYFRAGVPPGPPFGPADRELAAARHDRTIPVPASHATFAHAATGVHPRVKAKALPGAGGTGSMTSCGPVPAEQSIQCPRGFARGETRTRTGDTTIFSRAVGDGRTHAIPGNHAILPWPELQVDVRYLRAFARSSGDGGVPSPFFADALSGVAAPGLTRTTSA